MRDCHVGQFSYLIDPLYYCEPFQANTEVTRVCILQLPCCKVLNDLYRSLKAMIKMKEDKVSSSGSI